MSDLAAFERFSRTVIEAIWRLEAELAGNTANSQTGRVGRPRVRRSPELITVMRKAGLSWREVGRRLGIGPTTARRIHREDVKETKELPR
jgi:hypothetical protein